MNGTEELYGLSGVEGDGTLGAASLEAATLGPAIPEAAAGFDISYWQRTGMRWAEADRRNAFAYIRLSKGLQPDGAAPAHIAAAGKTKLLLGGYHYLDPRNSGVRQAILFWSLLDGLPCKLPAALDVEDTKLSARQVKDFCDEWARLTDAPLMIYTSASKWESICGRRAMWASGCLLWVAGWDVKKPALPDVWTEYTFWQWGVKPGPEYDKAIDRDRYNGTVAELRARFGGEKVAPAAGKEPAATPAKEKPVTPPAEEKPAAAPAKEEPVTQPSQGPAAPVGEEGPAAPAVDKEPATPTAGGSMPVPDATGQVPLHAGVGAVPAPAGEWTLAVTYISGSATIAGDCGQAGLRLIIVDPWLNEYPLISGSNPQHGSGGFELYERPAGAGYRLKIGGQELAFDHRKGRTFLKLAKG